MSVEYLGKVNNIVTVEKLRELTGITAGTDVVIGDISWLSFDYNGKNLLVADRSIVRSIKWDIINNNGFVLGKNIYINNQIYNCRLITGGNGDSSKEDVSEWKMLIVNLVPDDNVSNWSSSKTICQESSYGDASRCINRGYTKVDGINTYPKASYEEYAGWRPVLEKIDMCEITGVNFDMGEMVTFNRFKYNATNEAGATFNLTEKVDGKIIRTLNSQTSGEFTFNIESFDSLPYGNHTIEIIADDPTATGNSIVTSKFNKIKPPVQQIPTNSNLKQVMLHNKELEKEISYQNFRLSEKLKDNGVEVADVESLSSLISKTSNIGLNFTKQSGVVSAGGNQTINIDISPVDLSKSICWCQLKYNPSNQTAARYFISKFKTSSSLEISRLAYNLTFDVYWEVLEFKSGIRGIYNKLIKSNELSGGYDLLLNYKTLSHDFGILNHDKCVVFLSFSCNNSNNTAFVDIRNITSDAFDVILGGGNYSAFPEINVYIVELL